MSKIKDYAIELEERLEDNEYDCDIDFWELKEENKVKIDELDLIAIEDNCTAIDEDDVFFEYAQKEYGQIDLCGVTRDAIAVLAETDEDRYDEMKKAFIAEQVTKGAWIEVGHEFYTAEDVEFAVSLKHVTMDDIDPYSSISTSNALAA